MNRKNINYYLLYVVLFSLGLYLDIISKKWAVTKLGNGEIISIIPNCLEFRYLENTGAAFGILQGAGCLFVAVTVITVAFIIYFLFICPKEKKYIGLTVPSVLILSGAIGNFIDRITQNYVVDFIYISLIDFPIFNIADIFVTWDSVLLAFLIIFVYKDQDLKLIKLFNR